MGATIFLPNLCSIAMHKGELAYCLQISEYKLKQYIKQNERMLLRLGYSKYDKVLSPAIINVILQKTGLRVDQERLSEILGKTFLRLV